MSSFGQRDADSPETFPSTPNLRLAQSSGRPTVASTGSAFFGWWFAVLAYVVRAVSGQGVLGYDSVLVGGFGPGLGDRISCGALFLLHCYSICCY